MTRQRRRRTYGEGSVYQRKDGRWVGTIEAGYSKTGARRRVPVYGKTEAEAKQKLRDRRRALARDETAEASARATVKAWSETWLTMTARTARPKTHSTDKGAVRKWIVPTVGHRRLDQLTPADRRAVGEAIRSAGLPTSTVRRYDGTLVRMLKAAVEEGHRVPGNVLAVRAPKASAHDRRAMSNPEALAVLAEAQSLPHVSRWAAALLQAMRQGECLGLTWPQVGETSLDVSWQLQALPYVDKHDRSKGFLIPDGYEARQLDRSLHLVRPKSKAGWRSIPLIPWMRQALDEWREVAPDSPHGIVWPAPDGSPRRSIADAEEWQALQAAAGVAHPSGRPYHLHEARNTTATLLMELGVAESVRIAIMGHSSIAVTRGYEHVDQAQARAALERVAERLQLQ